MRELNNFIKDKKINFKKLEEFGFELIDNSYYYHTSLLKNQYKMSVKISLDNSIFTEIMDTETNEPYVLHLLEIKRSGYSEKVYKAYSEILAKIKEEIEFLKEGEEEVDDTRSMKFLYISLGISIITLIIVIITFFLKLK
ncbi:hypothetical protein FNCV3_09190 [Fusobacterium nucleatum]|nr:hypothetical protein FNCV3_09190 [Fusobacterium nucleatum]BEP05456.1 hypothetical protein FNSV3_08030 [Fusobacterium nucleatum]